MNAVPARFLAAAALACATVIPLEPADCEAAFGLAADDEFYTVDTGAELVFKVRRVDRGSNTQSPGDLASLVFRGVEYQDKSRGSQVNGGFDYLYDKTSEVTVSAETVKRDAVKITVHAGDLTHYYLARRDVPAVFMATVFDAVPYHYGMCRYIVRIPSERLPDGPEPSDTRGNTGAIESGDIFGLKNGETRSKHYSNERLKDWAYFGAAGRGVGVWMVRGNAEGMTGGPFYRSLLNQCGDDQELTYIVHYGMTQTEPARPGVLNLYTLLFTRGGRPKEAPGLAWLADMDLKGHVGPKGRGAVLGRGIDGHDDRHDYTVDFANSQARYWAAVDARDGSFKREGMLPGDYKLTLYKNELAVHWADVTVAAEETAVVPKFVVSNDPSAVAPLWRIGDWDGSPAELLNGDKITSMHPSDVRIADWNPGPFVVGESEAATGFPCCQWKDVNGTQAVEFDLTADQIKPRRMRLGLTTAYAGARPKIAVNKWNSKLPKPSDQPDTRSLTVGTYRGNNTTFTFDVPASAFIVGKNTLWISVISGSDQTGFLSPGYSVDCVELE